MLAGVITGRIAGTTDATCNSIVCNLTNDNGYGWASLVGIPAGFADNVDDVGNFTPGISPNATNLNASGQVLFSNLISCDTIDTDSNGVLSCGTDASTGGGGNTTEDIQDTIFPNILNDLGTATYYDDAANNFIVAFNCTSVALSGLTCGLEFPTIKVTDYGLIIKSINQTWVKQQFASSPNISYDTTNGLFTLNLSCVDITGSAALCDGNDAVGAGGSARQGSPPWTYNDSDTIYFNDTHSQLVFVNHTGFDNNTIIRINSTLTPNDIDAITSAIQHNATNHFATLNDLSLGNTTITSSVVIRNDEGVTMSKGDPVRFNSYITGVSRMAVMFANNSNYEYHADCIVAETIGSGNTGLCVQSGLVTKVDTTDFSELDNLYLDTGNLTNTKPTNTNCIQNIGMVLRSHANNGVIWVAGAGRCNDVSKDIDIEGFVNATVIKENNVGVITNSTMNKSLYEAGTNITITGNIIALATSSLVTYLSTLFQSITGAYNNGNTTAWYASNGWDFQNASAQGYITSTVTDNLNITSKNFTDDHGEFMYWNGSCRIMPTPSGGQLALC